MTEPLEQAFAAASELSDSDQNSFAAWIMAELNSDREWSSLFEKSQSTLASMAQDALSEHKAGETQDWNES